MDSTAMPFRFASLTYQGFQARHFARWLKTLFIGSLGIRIKPPNGWSSSRIRRRAQATENAEATKARVVVALGGATRLKPKKISTSQETSAISSDLETDGIDCACSSDLSWPSSTIRVAVCVLSAGCESSCGERRWMAT